MSASAHPLTQNYFPGDFKSSVKSLIVHVCVAAGTNVCIFQLINMLSDRNLFTRHAMHMSSKGKESIINKLIEVMSNIVDNHNMSEEIPMAWKNEPMELTDKLQLNNTKQLEITDVNSISNYVEPKGKLNSHLNTGHSEMKYKVSKRHRNCLNTKKCVFYGIRDK
jgi:hypothetical protein